jgi:hypothetical protein
MQVELALAMAQQDHGRDLPVRGRAGKQAVLFVMRAPHPYL